MNCFSFGKTHRIEEIKAIYNHKREEIRLRLDEFRKIWRKGTEEEIFAELVFCILTPMSRARSCWAAVENLMRKRVLFAGDISQIGRELNGVRFIYKKSEYIVEAGKEFLIDGKASIRSMISQINCGREAREWLVQDVKGIGYKEASHFLRNIGFDQNLAILDRHILKNLKFHGVIEEIPDSLSRRSYFEVERRMMKFSKETQIPMSHLDLVMWYKETGEIFK
ncbi:MAG: N-glycosylase/DNA lyase [Deltaproteobacteria bacterium]|nr:MAG: N-glycosylase/DNA lyase [Deltaproteobacteria bacterium]